MMPASLDRLRLHAAYVEGANATAVGRLIDAGALVIGKTNLDQFATGLVGVRTPYPVPRNRAGLQRDSSRPFAEASRPAQSGVRTFDMSTDDAVVWRGMTRAELDAAYNNSAAVANSAEKVTEWTSRTAALRAAHPDFLDLAYGPRPRNRIDVFRCGDPDAPLFAFLHGGYWQRNSKEVHGCMAAGPLARGFDVAMIGYTLSPDATLAEIVAETYDAIRWLRREGGNYGIGQGKLIVSGWSAGGHLAAMAMGLPEVDAGLAISGVYDVEPCRLNYLNEKLGLRAEDVPDVSPIENVPLRAGPLVVAYGSRELPELQRQSRDYRAAWMEAGKPGTLLALDDDHFSILEKLASPDGALTEALLALLNEP